MAFLEQGIDLSDLPEGSSDYALLPDGWYEALIKSAQLSPTKDGSGQYIKLRFDICGPTHQGRVVFSNINIRNASARAEEIGRQQLGDIMRAIGLSRVEDTDQLVGGRLCIKVGTRPERYDERSGRTYEASNEIKSYKALDGAAPPAPAAPVASAAPEKAAPPWAKK